MCPDENELTQFARGGARELPALEAHLDGCERCRRAVAAAASEQTLPGQVPSHELTPGLRVGRYEIERELGRGGMGVVYQARDVTLDRRVALKLLHARRDEAAQARLLREAQVMAKLAHPNVVPVFELGEWRNDLYLVMELVTGVTLEAWLKRAKHRRSDILEHFMQAGRGLAAAHAAGVVHRDFKPANVLVGLDDRVRVTDFGLSRPGPALELPATNSAVVTRDGAIVGTLAYMAPEQLDGKTADERSDQFSFCVALIEALAGQRPFKGETWSELAVSLGEKPRFGTGIPAQLRGVLRKGLEQNPAHRYASMTALLNAIERAQNVGWRTVAMTGGVALLVTGLISAQRMQPAPLVVANNAAAAPQDAEAAAEDFVPVVMAGVDMPAGTIVTFDMLVQRSMPARYITSSVIKPDAASYIIGQPLNVPVQRGDTLLWSQFEQMPAKGKTVLSVRQDVAEGSVLVRELLEEHQVPEEVATNSVVKPHAIAHVLGHRVKAPMRKGDLLLWSQVATQLEDEPGSLTFEEITRVAVEHHEQLARCEKLSDRELDLHLSWKVTAGGTPYNVEAAQEKDHPATLCLVKAISGWKFPERSVPTLNIDFPVRLVRPSP
ncbi:MAG: protein kinase [Archangium sp.]|nr:protein kinase [Archangium sp.]